MISPPAESDRLSESIHLTTGALIGYGVLFVAAVVGLVSGGAAASFGQIGLIYLPFLVLAVLAYLGLRYPSARIFALIWLLIILGVYLLQTLGFSTLAVSDVEILTSPDAMNPEIASIIGSVGGINVLAVLIACLGFVPTVRRGVSSLLPLNPESFVHTVALVVVTALLLMSFAPLLVLGQPPLLSDKVLGIVQESEVDGLLAQIYTLIWSVPVAIFAVGYGLRRNFSETLLRLGLVRPTLRQIALGVGVALVLVVAVNVLELGLSAIWQYFGWTPTDAEAFAELLSFAMNPVGAIVIGVTAGLGEELAVRGVLQPRLGILLSNLFFTSIHAFQYNWDALLIVFLVGIVFGLLRKYTNTSTGAITHGFYNFVVVMMAIYGISLFG
jgi:membrane protease YdiL (CAAX protease family)